MSDKFIITGAPGSGISTLFKALKKQGYTCFQDNISFKSNEKSGNPSNNPGSKSREERMLDAMLKRYQESNNHQSTCFFERAIPDLIAFLKYQKTDVPENTKHGSTTAHLTKMYLFCHHGRGLLFITQRDGEHLIRIWICTFSSMTHIAN